MVSSSYAATAATAFGSWITEAGSDPVLGPGCIYYDDYCQPVPNQTPCGGNGQCGEWTAAGASCNCNSGYSAVQGSCCLPWPATGLTTTSFLSVLPPNIGLEPAVITNINGVQKICGGGQSLALLSADCPLPHTIQVTYKWQSNSSSGFENYVIIGNINSNDGSDIPDPLVIGCDGGFSGAGFCVPTVSSPSSNSQQFYSGTPVALNPDTNYFVSATLTSHGVNVPYITVAWALTSGSNGLTPVASFTTNVNGVTTGSYTRAGLAIGRNGQQTCVTDFLYTDVSA